MAPTPIINCITTFNCIPISSFASGRKGYSHRHRPAAGGHRPARGGGTRQHRRQRPATRTGYGFETAACWVIRPTAAYSSRSAGAGSARARGTCARPPQPAYRPRASLLGIGARAGCNSHRDGARRGGPAVPVQLHTRARALRDRRRTRRARRGVHVVLRVLLCTGVSRMSDLRRLGL